MKLYKHCLADQCEEAATKDIIAAFNALPIWTRMRAVYAGTSPEVDLRRGLHPFMAEWPNLADQWEREDAEEVAHDSEIECLARIMQASDEEQSTYALDEHHYRRAQAILDAGYRKQANDGPR